jgi:hypothetical protein
MRCEKRPAHTAIHRIGGFDGKDKDGAVLVKQGGGKCLNADSAVPCWRRLPVVEASQRVKKLEKKRLFGKSRRLRKQIPAV